MDLILPDSGGILESLFNGPNDYMDSTNKVHPNASEEDLINALSALERGDVEFVILQDDQSQLFMQTAGSANEGYVLEYNDGSEGFNYQVSNANLSGVQVTDTLVAFLQRDPSWKTNFTWVKSYF